MNAINPRRSGSAGLTGITKKFSPFLLANILLLVVTLCAGGASRENAVPTAVVILAALCILPWALFRLARERPIGAPLGTGLAILALLVAVPIFLLIPLPPFLWTKLPSLNDAQRIYQDAGISQPWRPISITPPNAIHSALSLTVPVTIFLSWSTLRRADRIVAVSTILSIVCISVILGAIQLAGGDRSVGYLYKNTNYGSLVGFFSNRNHQASLLLCALPLTAALVGGTSGKRKFTPLMLLGLCVSALLAICVALFAVQSRLGVILMAPCLVLSFLLLVRRSGTGFVERKHLILIGIGFAILLAGFGAFGLRPVLERFAGGLDQEDRFLSAPIIWRSAVQHLPFGTGPGSFDMIYRSIEPLGLLKPAFLNHAHDDYLELFLEGGLAAVIVLGLFLIWWAFQAYTAWFKTSGSDRLWASAASVVTGTLLAFSAFDYPLRTLAMASVFAFACAMLIPPVGGDSLPTRRKRKI